MFSKWLADAIVKKSILPEEDIAAVSYGLAKMLALLEDMVFTVLIGSLLGIVWESLFFQILFMALRMYAGGCHSKTELRCKIYSGFVTIISLSCIKYIPIWNDKVYFLIPVVSIVIGILAPVEAKNKPLSNKERLVNRYKTIIALALLNLLAVVDLVLRWEVFNRTITVVISGVFILMIVGIIVNRNNN